MSTERKLEDCTKEELVEKVRELEVYKEIHTEFKKGLESAIGTLIGLIKNKEDSYIEVLEVIRDNYSKLTEAHINGK